MLALKLGMSLPSLSPLGWSPAEEGTLVAWYKNRTGLTTTGGLTPTVSEWADSSRDGLYDMVQDTVSEQPSYGTTTGALTFDSTNIENLQTSGADITLTGDFSIGVKLHLTVSGGTLLGDNTQNGEFIRFTGTTELRIRVASATAVNIDKDSGTFLEDAYMVLTRSSDIFKLYWKGVAQADTETKAGTALIDSIGVRNSDNNPYAGTISEIQIYSSSSTELTAQINTRLATL